MDFLIPYLPSIITILIITPLGGYVTLRLKALATKEDFDVAVEQLKRSTSAVESIKSQMNEKYWVKQQIWETKRSAYEELIKSLYFTQKYLDGLVTYYENYMDCFVHIGGLQSIGPYESPEEEEYQKSYAEYIESEQRIFIEKYESIESENERKNLLNEVNDSFIKLETIFSVNSIYLHSDLELIEKKIEAIKVSVFETAISQDEYESQSDFFERLLEHHLNSQKSLSKLINETKILATKDLKLDFETKST